jgi:hypothetical protein
MQFVAMLFGQLSGQHGLRSIETGMNSQGNSFYHAELYKGWTFPAALLALSAFSYDVRPLPHVAYDYDVDAASFP